MAFEGKKKFKMSRLTKKKRREEDDLSQKEKKEQEEQKILEENEKGKEGKEKDEGRGRWTGSYEEGGADEVEREGENGTAREKWMNRQEHEVVMLNLQGNKIPS